MRLTAADASELAQLLRAAARAEIMPRFRRLEPGSIRTKSGPTDFVTAADEGAERMIAAGLTRLHPGCLVVGEEATAADPGLLDRLADAELAFVVDPVDGTANFCAGLPLFGVMAAAVVRGEVAMAVIHDPVVDEASLAVRGEGAWSESPDGRRADLRVAAAVAPARMQGAASWRYMRRPLRDTVLRNLPNVGSSWDYRCAAHEYRAVAAGHWHYLLFHRLMPWDHLPGWLLHREAGGFSARLDGSEYRPGLTDGGLLCTPDRDSWVALRETLLAE